MILTEEYLNRIIIEEIRDLKVKRRPDIRGRGHFFLTNLVRNGSLTFYDARVEHNLVNRKVMKPSGNISCEDLNIFKEYLAKYHPKLVYSSVLVPNEERSTDYEKHYDVKIIYKRKNG